jgi:hypothetical protein
MWNIKGNSPEEKVANIRKVMDSFASLPGNVPGLLNLEIGVNVSGVDYACDVVLYSEFESVDALNLYADHPEHLRVRDEVAGLRVARHQVDYVAG